MAPDVIDKLEKMEEKFEKSLSDLDVKFDKRFNWMQHEFAKFRLDVSKKITALEIKNSLLGFIGGAGAVLLVIAIYLLQKKLGG